MAELERRLQDALSDALGLVEQNDLEGCQPDRLEPVVLAAEELRRLIVDLCGD